MATVKDVKATVEADGAAAATWAKQLWTTIWNFIETQLPKTWQKATAAAVTVIVFWWLGLLGVMANGATAAYGALPTKETVAGYTPATYGSVIEIARSTVDSVTPSFTAAAGNLSKRISALEAARTQDNGVLNAELSAMSAKVDECVAAKAPPVVMLRHKPKPVADPQD